MEGVEEALDGAAVEEFDEVPNVGRLGLGVDPAGAVAAGRRGSDTDLDRREHSDGEAGSPVYE